MTSFLTGRHRGFDDGLDYARTAIDLPLHDALAQRPAGGFQITGQAARTVHVRPPPEVAADLAASDLAEARRLFRLTLAIGIASVLGHILLLQS